MTTKPVIYGSKLSVSTRRVLLVLEEKNIDYDFVAINTAKGEQKSQGYVNKQPFGSIPLLIHGDLTLFESRAMCRYIEAKYPSAAVAADGTSSSRLVPTGLTENAMFEQAASIEASQFEPIVAAINFEKRLKKLKGLGDPDEEKCKQLVTNLETKLDAYERILSKQAYLGGDHLTLADLFHLPVGSWVKKWYPEVFERRPNVNRWWLTLEERPAWIKVDGDK
ncbi:hypothetical protein H2204_002890 [Knufia peltigerae]|uniref:glutathione transferase n=1 Tax=Knufia peltigerae TaxID=1002370 RepID=A0AA38YAI1_9EURO|nr:hypothetical protein H2204_002890 [Knufia peltigerae]